MRALREALFILSLQTDWSTYPASHQKSISCKQHTQPFAKGAHNQVHKIFDFFCTLLVSIIQFYLTSFMPIFITFHLLHGLNPLYHKGGCSTTTVADSRDTILTRLKLV